MLKEYKIENILFLDIETVPLYPDFESMPEKYRYFWDKKSAYFRDDEETAADVYQRAGIYAEFGKIICISVGLVWYQDNQRRFRIKSFYGDNEKDFLPGFIDMLNKMSERDESYLCAHNGKEFDFPYIARRILINGLQIPEMLEVAGKKPWEVSFLDTMQLWKFGDFKNYTSLDLLSYIFDIPTPKDDIDGSMVAEVFYREQDLKRIVQYCEKDVLAIAQLFLRYKGDELIAEDCVDIVTY